MRNALIPEGAEIVRTYDQYDALIGGFFDARYNSLIVIGRPGLAKSHSFEQRLSATSHLIRGWAAPLQCYIESYHHRNKLLIFDDAESLWKRPGGRVLLRSLCEHHDRKLVQWTSTAPGLVAAGVPQSFTTASKVALIANRFASGDQDEYAAIADRAHIIYFDPSPLEVHIRVSGWFWDQEIFQHIGERLHLLDTISSRLYLKAWERRRAGGDWKKLIEESFCQNHTQRIVQALEVDPSCNTVDDRIQKFREMTGACRATYFNVKRRLMDQQQLQAFEKIQTPKLELRGVVPPDIDLEAEVAKVNAEELSPKDDEDPNRYAGIEDPAQLRKHLPEEEYQGRGVPLDDNESKKNIVDSLCRELERAIRREDYERAAQLRDQIRGMENHADDE